VQATFERYQSPHQVDTVIASTSLHHVSDLDQVLDRIATVLVPGGTVVVIEWAWERIDEATARWCFARPDTHAEPSWLTKHRDEWHPRESWAAYFTGWARDQGLHPSDEIQRALDQRFQRLLSADRPYYFPDLADTSESDDASSTPRLPRAADRLSRPLSGVRGGCLSALSMPPPGLSGRRTSASCERAVAALAYV
jgi:SAM-dependent methyltransferase